MNTLTKKITKEQERKNQEVREELKERDGGAGHPDFLVFNLSPWEAHPAPAVS